MAYKVLRTLLDRVEVFRPAFTAPGFDSALVVFVGWVLTQGAHAVTQALVETDVARRVHHERYHRFFSRGAWSPDELGRIVFEQLLRWVDGPLVIALDDTLAPKKGPRVFGLGTHLDAVRSTKKFRVFCFGHVWVVLSVVVKFPFASRGWALPILFRLYRNKKDFVAKEDAYKKKTELARALVDIVVNWAGDRRISLTADSAYCNDTLSNGLDARVTIFGAIRPDAVLTSLPTERERQQTGRRRKRGKLLPKPEALAKDSRRSWQSCKARLYGRVCDVSYKTLDAQWYRGTGTQLVRIVVVRVLSGSLGIRVFLCTDPSIDVATILETYAERWAIEVCFRDLKQLLGFADSSARKREAVERIAPFVGYIYTTLALWFAENISNTQVRALPIRPWYPHKAGFCFADVLRSAQRVLANVDVLDPARSLANLRRRVRNSPRPRIRGSSANPRSLKRVA